MIYFKTYANPCYPNKKYWIVKTWGYYKKGETKGILIFYGKRGLLIGNRIPVEKSIEQGTIFKHRIRFAGKKENDEL